MKRIVTFVISVILNSAAFATLIEKIPLPGTPGDEFAAGFKNFNETMDRVMQYKIERRRLEIEEEKLRMLKEDRVLQQESHQLEVYDLRLAPTQKVNLRAKKIYCLDRSTNDNYIINLQNMIVCINDKQCHKIKKVNKYEKSEQIIVSEKFINTKKVLSYFTLSRTSEYNVIDIKEGKYNQVIYSARIACNEEE